MDDYIRDFDVFEVQTLEAETIGHLKEIFNNHSSVSSFRIFHSNIRSVQKNFSGLEAVVGQFEDYFFDLIVLTETWQIKNIDLFNLHNYTKFYSDGDVNQNDGVLVYVRSDLNFNFKIETIAEVRCIEINIKSGDKYTRVTSIYRPHTISVANFNTELSEYLGKVSTNQVDIIIGDINIDILKESDAEVQDYLNIMYTNGFKSLVNKPTRVEKDTNSCIDHIFLRSQCLRVESPLPVILHSKITDHFPTILGLPFKANSPKQNIEKKQFINYRKLRYLLQQTDLDSLLESDDVDYIANYLVNTITSTTENCTFVKTVKTRNGGNKWITLGLINSMEVRDKLYKKYKRNKDEGLYSRYKEYRNMITKLTRELKQMYYRDIIDKNKNNSKKIWAAVNNYSNKQTKVSGELREIKHCDKIITDKRIIAETFNSYYATIGEKMANNILTNRTKSVKRDEMSHSKDSIFLVPVTEREVVNIVTSLKQNSAPGHDNISTKVLKEAVNELAGPLSHLINTIFVTGRCPAHFKVAMVTPIFKGGDRREISNYRPISIISNICKIFEKAFKERLVNFITKHNTLSSLQFGFRNNISTNDAIGFLTGKIYSSLETGKPCAGVFLDLAKAFDTVCHKRLLSRLYSCGVRGLAYSVLKEYLEGRKQRVKIGKIVSAYQNINYGIPQGTVLGPVLFIVYINSLLSLETFGKIFSFADDTVLFVEGNDWEDVECKIKSDIVQIIRWLDNSLLTINLQKTVCLPFCNYKDSLPANGEIIIHLPFRIDPWKLKYSLQTKYLGIYIDCNLRWNIQTEYLAKKMRSLFFMFKQLTYILDEKTLRTFYFALVQSHLEYGIVGWGGAYNAHLTSADVAQKTILKIMHKLPYRYPTNSLFNTANVLSLRKLFYKKSILYCNRHNLLSKSVTHVYPTRFRVQDNLMLPKIQKTIGKRCFKYVGQKVFNSIPQELKHRINQMNFKKLISSWLQENELDVFK